MCFHQSRREGKCDGRACGGGAEYSFECIGNVEVMRQALECCHRGEINRAFDLMHHRRIDPQRRRVLDQRALRVQFGDSFKP